MASKTYLEIENERNEREERAAEEHRKFVESNREYNRQMEARSIDPDDGHDTSRSHIPDDWYS